MQHRVVRIADHSLIPSLVPQNSLIVDAGANVGSFAVPAAMVLSATVLALEPIKSLADQIDPNDRLMVWNKALGARLETSVLHGYDNKCASTLNVPNETPTSSITVDIVSFEHILEKLKVQEIALLKLDIEGAEVEFLEQLDNDQFSSILQMTIEFHEKLFPEHRTRVSALRKKLRSQGFLWINFSNRRNTDVLVINVAKLKLSRPRLLLLLWLQKYWLGIGRTIERRVRRQPLKKKTIVPD